MIYRPENKRNVPSLFTCLDGTEVKTAEDWTGKRRPEILEILRREEYGRLPDMGDVQINIRVAAVRQGGKIMNGRAIRKTVEVEAVRGNRNFIFTFEVFIPVNADKPVPAFVEICNRGTMNCDPAREFYSSFYPAETIISRGYACAVFRTQEVAPDYEEGFSIGFHRLFPEYQDSRPDDAWGTITVWAWAASRVMDYFETEPLIDEKRAAVVGHSRGGKTALWCGAQDERFAMAVSSCSGNSGDAISRGKTGESIGQILDRFPFWFAKNYQKYAGHEEEMPFDQHFLVALMAPRLVYTSTKTNDSWADPASEFESLVQASPVYGLFGLKGLDRTEPPLPENPLHEGSMGHHHKTGDHDMDEYDWNQYMNYADMHMV
ncbi:prolyl oligopeptidase family serine peptidase [Lachnoclostridium pacaense]|uniref:alpha/beta hydrolase family protein n=1 Tax=Enterocloster hominis (ex Hitch et al. 2024) TaxID=1917870 RepID=UPI001D10B8F4|nr:prolyl oligopeptidase family serine peptidase [Lachnoclostridium pacaense]MCC2816393.1 prolyl oligopeptidase family serine peptidase [Lachnoclostridium pacaense]